MGGGSKLSLRRMISKAALGNCATTVKLTRSLDYRRELGPRNGWGG